MFMFDVIALSVNDDDDGKTVGLMDSLESTCL